jgi:hypothetical protein|tara:strand:- start:230 stop:685 length:456 start_codon:yes stop_codon:yes gene_type:complete
MINAWRLLYDEVLKMKTDHYFDEMPENIANQFTEAFEDFDIDLITGYKMKDLTNENGFWKYDEEVIVKELLDYISGTYNQHYSAGDDKIQTLDLIEACGDGEAFCRSNILKYASRYDKKGTARRDIMKILHYAVLLMYFNDKNAQRETYNQ